MANTAAKSNLDLVSDCDSFPYYQIDPDAYLQLISSYYRLKVAGVDQTVGYVIAPTAEIFRGLQSWTLDDDEGTLTLEGATADERTNTVAITTAAMRETGKFEVLNRWRGELYPVYGPNRELLFNMERSASPLFGVVTYGVHVNAYVRSKDGSIKIWVPRRSRGKHTYPGMLDNAVAGGMSSGEIPLECLVRECEEEASLPQELVRERSRACGTVTYFYIRDARAGGETNLLQPEVQYIYDLELPEETVLKPNDDEVEEFYLWTVDQVQDALSKAEFKPNCALVMLDFFIRHGILTCDNEKDYIEIVSRLHRRLDFPTL